MTISVSLDEVATARTRARYQRLSSMYDRMEGIAERRYAPWRTRPETRYGLGLKANFQLGDVQALSFPNASFDAAIAII